MIALVTVICACIFGWSWLTVGMLTPSIYLCDTATLWVFYLAVMHLQQVRDAGKLPAAALPLAKAVLYFGLAVDFIYNMTWASVVFLDPPREWLVTGRLERYKYKDAVAWRVMMTEWFARVLLDPFDPSGQHVRP